VAIDIECFELDHRLVTEVGFAAYHSTSFITDVFSGSLEHAAHFIVEENEGFRNGRFVDDNQDHFNFGLSECVRLNDIKEGLLQRMECAGKGLPVILVGHSVQGDLEKLKEIGCDLEEYIAMTWDIAIAWEGLNARSHRTSLGGLLQTFNIEYHHLHNAGNDAVYTLQAAAGMLDLVARGM